MAVLHEHAHLSDLEETKPDIEVAQVHFQTLIGLVRLVTPQGLLARKMMRPSTQSRFSCSRGASWSSGAPVIWIYEVGLFMLRLNT